MKYKRCLLRCSGTRVHTSFYSMKGQRAFLLSPGWYAGSLQDKHTPPPLPHLFRLWYTTYLFSGVKGEDYCGSMVSCPGTQHDKPLRAWKLPESHRLTKTQQFSLVCVCSQVSVSIHSLCRCSDTYSYINGEKMVNFLVCESVFFFFFATVEPPAPVINFSYIPFKLINLRETKDFIHVIKVQLLYNMQLRFCVGSIINRFQLKDLSRCKILESLEMKI